MRQQARPPAHVVFLEHALPIAVPDQFNLKTFEINHAHIQAAPGQVGCSVVKLHETVGKVESYVFVYKIGEGAIEGNLVFTETGGAFDDAQIAGHDGKSKLLIAGIPRVGFVGGPKGG